MQKHECHENRTALEYHAEGETRPYRDPIGGPSASQPPDCDSFEGGLGI